MEEGGGIRNEDGAEKRKRKVSSLLRRRRRGGKGRTAVLGEALGGAESGALLRRSSLTDGGAEGKGRKVNDRLVGGVSLRESVAEDVRNATGVTEVGEGGVDGGEGALEGSSVDGSGAGEEESGGEDGGQHREEAGRVRL
jgi:hypothetical protein